MSRKSTLTLSPRPSSAVVSLVRRVYRVSVMPPSEVSAAMGTSSSVRCLSLPECDDTIKEDTDSTLPSVGLSFRPESLLALLMRRGRPFSRFVVGDCWKRVFVQVMHKHLSATRTEWRLPSHEPRCNAILMKQVLTSLVGRLHHRISHLITC